MPDSSGQAALAAVLLSVSVVAAALVAKLAPEPYMVRFLISQPADTWAAALQKH
jgi:hypothetical protein